MSAFRVKFFLSSKQFGVTETLLWNRDGGNLELCAGQSILLASARRALLPSDWTMDGISVDGIPTMRQGKRLYREAFVGAGPINNGPADCVPQSVFVRLFDSTYRWKRTYWLHAIPKAFIKPSPSGVGGDQLLTPSGVKAVWNWIAAAGALTSGAPAPAKVNYVIGSNTDGSGLPPPRSKILGVSVNPAGFFQINVDDPDFNPIPGDVVHVHNANYCTLAGLNGKHIVTAVTGATPPAEGGIYTLNVKQCCKGALLNWQKATVYQGDNQFIPIVNALIGRVTFRSIGKPVINTRGRDRKSACPCR